MDANTHCAALHQVIKMCDDAMDPVFLEGIADALDRNLHRWKRDQNKHSAWVRNIETIRIKAANERRAMAAIERTKQP